MKLDDVTLCNLALDQVGQQANLIASLTDGSNAAAICNRNYNQTIRNVLRAGRWKSARVKLSLAQRTDLTDPSVGVPASPSSLGVPVGGWPPGNTNYSITDDGLDPNNGMAFGNPQMAYAFQLPQDYIRLVRFNDVDSSCTSYPFWEIRGDILWTNQLVAFLEYVRDVTMPGVTGTNAPTIGTLDPDLQDVIVKALAARLAWVFQQSQKLQQQLVQEYDRMLSRALAIDARSEKVALRNPYQDSSWIRSRWVSTAH